MIRALAQDLEKTRLLAKDDAVVVGVSGGPDSTALLHLLIGLNQQAEWSLRLHVAHLNHGLRGDDAEKDAAFVQAACDSLSLTCTIEHKDIAALSDKESIGLEEIGRRERYAFFHRVCLQTGSKLVAVGHQADDNAETVLHRIFRGTGLRGLTGIPRSRLISPDSDIRLIRPLLSFTREELGAYLADTGIAYREDRSNLSNEPMRNRIRNTLLPEIEAHINPQAREAILRLAVQAGWLEDFLKETVQRTFDTLLISRTDQVLALNAEALARKSRIVQAELIRMAYASFGLGEQDLAFTHLAAAIDLVLDSTTGRQTIMPGGMIVERRYQQLIFSLETTQPREMIASEVAIHLPGQTLLPLRALEIECFIEDACPQDIRRLRRHADRMEEYVDLDAVHAPLVVRGRKPGERFLPLGAPGSKKLSEFLADEKVDQKQREQVAVLCDQLGPIWVIGHRIDDRVKVTALTRRVLHLRAKPFTP